MKNQYPYRSDEKFQTPNSQGQIVNPYDQDSRLFQDLIQRQYAPVHVETINLSVAGSKFINVPGFHFVCYFHDKSAIKNNVTNGMVNVFINRNSNDGSNPFPAKHARGFSGPFAYLFIEWVAQNTPSPVFVDVIVFKGAQKPWIDGESCT